MRKFFLCIFAAVITLPSFAQWTTSGSSIYNSNSGHVGIGTSSPLTTLDVKLATNQHIQFTTNVNGAYLGASGIVAINDANTAYTPIGFYASNYYFGHGNVGIGTTNPIGKLDVNGAILLPGSASNSTTRPTIGSARVTGEIAGYNGANMAMDDGFLRLSAGGGTNAIKTFIDLSGYSTVPDMDRNITFGTNGSERMRVDINGNVSIGTNDPKGYKLAVNGTAIATSMKVKLQANWPDFVFLKDYKLPTLTEVKTYIDKNQHLPDMPSAEEVHKNGLDLGEINRLLLKKVEELTLYLIEKDKQLFEQQAEIKLQNQRITKLENAKSNQH